MHCLERMAHWIILGGAIALSLSPFFVTLTTSFPAVFLRVIVVRSVIEIMGLTYLCLCLFHKDYRPRQATIAWAVGAFLLAFLCATLFGINPYRSFWGSHERMEGYVTLLHFGALFLVLYGTCRTPEAYKKILWASVLISVVQCGYAFGQLPGIDVQATKPYTQLYDNGPTRIVGTFGNAPIFALYLLFQSFFASMLFFGEKYAWRRVVLVGIFLINGMALFLSGSRGAMLSMYAGIGLIALGHGLLSGHRRRRIGGIVALGLIVTCLGGLYIWRDSQFVQDHYLLRRATIFAAPGTPITSRWTAWKIGLEAWQERFWFGYGMDNFNYAFNHYYNPWMVRYDAGDFDRPHNRFVESLVTGGLFGMVTHLAVFATAGWFLLTTWWRHRSSGVPLAGLGLLVAYLVQLCSLFDHLISYQCFAIFLAFCATWEVQPATREPPTSRWDVAGMPSKIGLAALAVMSMTIFMWYANILPTVASARAHTADTINALSQGREFRRAFETLQGAFALETYLNVDMRLGFASFATSGAQTAKTAAEATFGRQVLEYFADQFSHNLHDHHPDIKDFLSHMIYGHMAQMLAQYDPAWMEKALECYRQGLAEYPARYQLIDALARAYLRVGRAEDAVNVYETHPLEVARGDFFFNYATTLYAIGRHEDAWQQSERAVAFGYDFTRHLPQLVAVLAQEQRYDRIARLYEYQLRSYQKDNLQLMASLAHLYKTMGDHQNARRVAAQLLAMDALHQQDIGVFLQSLERTGVP